jgi:hypothetical protein
MAQQTMLRRSDMLVPWLWIPALPRKAGVGRNDKRRTMQEPPD